MLLLMRHPEVAYRDCDHCQKWQYNEDTGKVINRRGEPLPRIGKPPCRMIKPDGKTGCPKGSPENSNALNGKNLAAFEHYLECKATGQFPDDAIVRRNASVIRRVEDSVEAMRRDDQYLRMVQLLRG